MGLQDLEGFAVQSVGPSTSAYWQHLDVRAVPKWPGHSPALLLGGGGEGEGSCWCMWAEEFQGSGPPLECPRLWPSVHGDGVEGSSSHLPPLYTHRWTYC